MTTIEDKINLFSKIIYDKVNEEKEEKLKTFNEEAEKKLIAEKENIIELRKNLERDVTKKSNTKANEIIAREKLNKQREILMLKDNLINDTLKEVKDKLLDFVSSEEYKKYFLNMLEKTLKEVERGSYYLILLSRDYERFKDEIAAIDHKYVDTTLVIQVSKEDFIGGIILKDLEGTFKIDNSLYTKLQESKELIGVRVMEMLA